MHAMQYEITLPADYDTGIIRERVATRGHLLDDFPGLGLKAYLMRERAEGSPVNQYAPFYLWAAPEGMNGFLWGPGFQGIVDDFGRPVVQHWTGLAYEEGPPPVPCRGPRHAVGYACRSTTRPPMPWSGHWKSTGVSRARTARWRSPSASIPALGAGVLRTLGRGRAQGGRRSLPGAASVGPAAC